jgi:hypothetical protein
MQLAVLRQSFDRGHFPPIRLDGEQCAGFHGNPINKNGAGAALTCIAAYVRAGQPEILSQEVHKQQPRIDLTRMALAVDGKLDLM